MKFDEISISVLKTSIWFELAEFGWGVPGLAICSTVIGRTHIGIIITLLDKLGDKPTLKLGYHLYISEIK
jgi:hypothetical protein